MKVIALNGSPKKNGNTFTSLNLMSDVFAENGIDYEIIHLGVKPLSGCIACGKCDRDAGKCVIANDSFNEIAQKLASADGIIIGSPVYYGGIAGSLKCFLDRFFYTNTKKLYYKPVAAVCSLRRSGGVGTFNQLNNYFSLSRSLVVPTSYWSAFHGCEPGEVEQDLEAWDCVKEVATNMSWLLNVFDKTEVPLPKVATRRFMNFIR